MTLREFTLAAFERAGLDWKVRVGHDPRYARPAEVAALIGDASKARSALGWAAQTHGINLVNLMLDADIAALDDELSGRASASATLTLRSLISL